MRERNLAVNMKKKFDKKLDKPKIESKKTGKSKRPTAALIALGVVAVLAIIIAIYFIFFVKPPSKDNKNQGNVSEGSSVIKSDKTKDDEKEIGNTDKDETDDKDKELTEEDLILEMADEINVDDAKQKDGFFTVLVVGTDKSGLLTDTIIVATFDTNTKSASLLNVPRDTITSSSTSKKYRKINSEYSAGGIERTIKELKNLLGYEVNRHIIVDFDAFTNLIDAIDGVEIDVPKRMYYRDPDQDLLIDIKAGLQTLDGETCLEYMRYRKGYANQDYGRIEAQQKVYKAVAKKLATPSTLLKLPDLVNVVLENVETDLTLGEMIWIGTNYITMDIDDLYTDTLPSYGTTLSDGLSYVVPYKNDTIKLVNEKFNPYVDDITNVIHASGYQKKSSSSSSSSTSTPTSSGTSSSTGSSGDSDTTGSIEVDNTNTQVPEWLAGMSQPGAGSSSDSGQSSTGSSTPSTGDDTVSGGTIDVVE